MVFINIEQNKLKQNIYEEKEIIKKEIEEELEKLKPEIGLKNIKKFKKNITEMINKPIQIGLMYTLGNAKLPKTTMIINLGTWFNCAGRKEEFCELCKKCYDKSPEVRFKERFFGRYNQEIMWRSLPAELIAETIIKELKKHNKVNLIRWAEVGELRNQNDLDKLIKISTIIGEATGIKSYIYTHFKPCHHYTQPGGINKSYFFHVHQNMILFVQVGIFFQFFFYFSCASQCYFTLQCS